MLRRLLAWVAPSRPTLPPDAVRTSFTPVVADVTDAGFDAVVLDSPLPVLVDFWAEWCQPCAILSPRVEMLARDLQGRLRVVALDVDENPQTAERFRIMGLPTLLLLRDGQEIARHVGLLGTDELRALVEQALLSAPASPPANPAE